jgi:hypothetical protein
MVGEVILTLPQMPNNDERKEAARLEFHWTMAENSDNL